MMAANPRKLRELVGFRPIRSDDDSFLYELYASTREDELAPLDWDSRQKEQFLMQQFNAQHEFYQTHFSDADFLVVLLKGEPIGRLYVHRSEDEIRLRDIALLPAFRGAGIGSMMIEAMLEEAVEAGKPVRIHVERFNRALRLYERLGFSRIGDNGVYYLMEWSPAEAFTEADR